MKILSITAQKPDSTGSGIYLSELVKGFEKLGHQQAVIAGIYREDEAVLPEGVRLFPVYFKSEELPFPIAGMSDEMPYESTVYSTMTEEMTRQFMEAFRTAVMQAVETFRPDMILCHHLYLVTAVVRACIQGIPVYGFCHNTDIRQMMKHSLQREFIRQQVGRLDGIFALHEAQKERILKVYPVPEERIRIAGTGYNSSIFYRDFREEERAKSTVRLVFAGKISRKKGVESLLKSLKLLPKSICGNMELALAGGSGNIEEYEDIRGLAKTCPCKVEFLGKLSQQELAKVYHQSDLFVLPSFYEGLPLTVIEALACGDKVVVTDLPGIRPFLDSHLPGAPVYYVEPPVMEREDEPAKDSLETFETRLAEKMKEAIEQKTWFVPDCTGLSWEAVCKRVLDNENS